MLAPADLARATRPSGRLRLVPVLECGRGLLGLFIDPEAAVTSA